MVDQLHSAENEFLLDSDHLYITPALVELFRLYAKDCLEAIQGYLRFLNVFIPLFMTAFVLVMALWFLPQTSTVRFQR